MQCRRPPCNGCKDGFRTVSRLGGAFQAPVLQMDTDAPLRTDGPAQACPEQAKDDRRPGSSKLENERCAEGTAQVAMPLQGVVHSKLIRLPDENASYRLPQLTRRMQKPIGVHRVGRVSYPPCRVFYPAHPTQDGPHFGRHAQPMADVPGRIPGTAGETPALPKTRRPALSPVVSGRWYQFFRRPDFAFFISHFSLCIGREECKMISEK